MARAERNLGSLDLGKVVVTKIYLCVLLQLYLGIIWKLFMNSMCQWVTGSEIGASHVRTEKYMTREQYTTRTRYHVKDDEFARAIGIDLRGTHEAEPHDELELSEEVLDPVEVKDDGHDSSEEKNLVDADLWSGLHQAV
jgi:hypothetical protein